MHCMSVLLHYSALVPPKERSVLKKYLPLPHIKLKEGSKCWYYGNESKCTAFRLLGLPIVLTSKSLRSCQMYVIEMAMLVLGWTMTSQMSAGNKWFAASSNFKSFNTCLDAFIKWNRHARTKDWLSWFLSTINRAAQLRALFNNILKLTINQKVP